MSKDELIKLKKDVAEVQEKLKVLTDEELDQVFGGFDWDEYWTTLDNYHRMGV